MKDRLFLKHRQQGRPPPTLRGNFNYTGYAVRLGAKRSYVTVSILNMTAAVWRFVWDMFA